MCFFVLHGHFIWVIPLICRYASENNITKYVKIAASLRDKTVRDVALRCRWMMVTFICILLLRVIFLLMCYLICSFLLPSSCTTKNNVTSFHGVVLFVEKAEETGASMLGEENYGSEGKNMSFFPYGIPN